MPFCPKCRYEYEPLVSICPDCDVRLVSKLAEPEDEEVFPHSQYKDWVQLARLTSQQHASQILEVLQSKEIPSVILSGAGHFGQTGQMGTDSFRPVGGGYTLVVPKEFVYDADQEALIIFGDQWETVRLIDKPKEW